MRIPAVVFRNNPYVCGCGAGITPVYAKGVGDENDSIMYLKCSGCGTESFIQWEGKDGNYEDSTIRPLPVCNFQETYYSFMKFFNEAGKI